MAGSLSPSPVGQAAVLLPRRCRLSRRRVRKLLDAGEWCWVDSLGRVWKVRNVYRVNSLVALEGVDGRPRWVSFDVLGASFRPMDEP